MMKNQLSSRILSKEQKLSVVAIQNRIFFSDNVYVSRASQLRGRHRNYQRMYDGSVSFKFKDEDGSVYDQNRSVFALSTFEEKSFEFIDVTTNDETHIQSVRLVGLFLHESDAKSVVLSNACDINELCYKYAAIDEYVNGEVVSRQWYVWEEDSYVVACDSDPCAIRDWEGNELIPQDVARSGFLLRGKQDLQFKPQGYIEEFVDIGLYGRSSDVKWFNMDGTEFTEIDSNSALISNFSVG